LSGVYYRGYEAKTDLWLSLWAERKVRAMNKKMIEELLGDMQVRCPNAVLTENTYSWEITVSSGISREQLNLAMRYRDFTRIDIVAGKLQLSFDK
jgi:hypothetical protein